MRTTNRTRTWMAGLLVALVAGATAWQRWEGRTPFPAPPATPAGTWDLLLARPFTLEQPYRHSWRAERPLVDCGWLLVLAAEPGLFHPRETAEPVLYVGDQTAERFNKGHHDGALVAIVPSARGADGLPVLDLIGTPVWFGTAALPEEIDAAAIALEADLAARAGIAVLAPQAVQRAREAGEGPLNLADREALDFEAAQLVLRYAPGERDFAESRLVERR